MIITTEREWKSNNNCHHQLNSWLLFCGGTNLFAYLFIANFFFLLRFPLWNCADLYSPSHNGIYRIGSLFYLFVFFFSSLILTITIRRVTTVDFQLFSFLFTCFRLFAILLSLTNRYRNSLASAKMFAICFVFPRSLFLSRSYFKRFLCTMD